MVAARGARRATTVASVPRADVAPAGILDEELTALALAADPDAPIPDDAEPWTNGAGPAGLLPAWYMPPAVRTARRGRRVVVAVVVGTLLLVSGAGLCVTSGFPEIAW
jgi:hypothetical protein